MKKIILFHVFFAFLFLNNLHVQADKPKFLYTEAELIHFADSISKLNPTILATRIAAKSDSIFRNQRQLNIEISSSDLKNIKNKNLTAVLLKKIDPQQDLNDLTMNHAGFIQINIHLFSKDKFAMEIVKGPESDLYFFSGKKIIAKHTVFYRYALNLNFFLDKNKEAVIYYKRNFDSGSGIWWFNYCFYKYDNETLIPVLDEVQESNCQYPWGFRIFNLKTSIQQTNPLIIKMNYYDQIFDKLEGGIYIIKDSTQVTYNWDADSKKYIPDFSKSKLDRNKILSYYVRDDIDLLFILSHYDLIKAILHGKEESKKGLILDYLNQLKNYYR